MRCLACASLPPVEQLRLHFSNRAQPDRPLSMGVHRIVREASGHVGVGDHLQGALLVRICVDRRGLWLQVPTGMRGVHVNGRPVQRMALLRAGDTIYVDGVELLVQASHLPPEPASEPMPAAPDPRIILRGVGGKYHGRSIPLLRPVLVGRAREAAIRVDDPVFAERHAHLEVQGDRVLLRDLGSADGSLVNGVATREALLVAGDQLVFDPQHRFVVEVPWTRADAPLGETEREPIGPAEAEAPPLRRAGTVRRWPWLLLAALLLAAALSALLLFGSG